jgi:hypothetical protein
MGSLDVPEVLIGLGLLALAGWAVYNWRRTISGKGAKAGKVARNAKSLQKGRELQDSANPLAYARGPEAPGDGKAVNER